MGWHHFFYPRWQQTPTSSRTQNQLKFPGLGEAHKRWIIDNYGHLPSPTKIWLRRWCHPKAVAFPGTPTCR